MLEAAVGVPVYLENDANLAGLGEFHDGLAWRAHAWIASTPRNHSPRSIAGCH
jgi:predicted NBD/HSP70 family sugar kinase